MTRTLRALAFFQALVLTTAAQALTVQIDVTHHYCGQYTGCATAEVFGGVPPYTYSWSTGETTASIQDLVLGPLSVTVTDFEGTQASANATVGTQEWEVFSFVQAYCNTPALAYQGTGLFAEFPYCGTYIDVVHPVEINMFTGFPVELGPPYNGTFLIHGFFSAQPGVNFDVPAVDANGCSGTIHVQMGWPVEFPVVGILNVEGSCAGAPNGSILFAHTAEGHGQATKAYLRNDATGQIVQSMNLAGTASIRAFTGLAPGAYWLRQHVDPLFSAAGINNLCGDSMLVSVPDLGAACGNVNGTVYMDYDEDCVMGNSSETRVPGALLEFTPGPYYATANGVGAYSLNLPSGTYAMQQIAADIAQHCPTPPAPVNVSGVQTINVGDTALVPLDAEVMIASGAARPGFVLQYAIQQSNLTPATTGATSTVMTFDPTVTFITANPTPSLISGTTLTWNQAALGAFQQRTIHVQFQVPPDVGLIGNVLSASVSLSTANTDAVVANNSASTSVTITASFDPNDKTARTSSQWSNDLYYIDVDNWIDYTIRFQNTGTDTAFTVIITDTLPGTLDPSTIQWGAASHACMRSLVGQGVVKHIFPNILLPDSNVNEAASHGFASFRIRPHLPLAPATVIENIANIYFDFNPPVITEPSVLVAEFSTEVVHVPANTDRSVNLYPNPAGERVVVSVENGTVAELAVLAVDGRVLLVQRGGKSRMELDLGLIPTGIFVVQVHLVDGTMQILKLAKH